MSADPWIRENGVPRASRRWHRPIKLKCPVCGEVREIRAPPQAYGLKRGDTDLEGAYSKRCMRHRYRSGKNSHVSPAESRAKLADRSWLKNAYASNSSIEIARDLDCSSQLVLWWIKRHGIEVHDRVHHRGGRRTRSELLLNGERLRSAYEKMTIAAIAEQEGVGRETVRRWMAVHEIQARDASTAALRFWATPQDSQKGARNRQMVTGGKPPFGGAHIAAVAMPNTASVRTTGIKRLRHTGG